MAREIKKKYTNKPSEGVGFSTKFWSLFFLFIMVASIGGFALLSGGSLGGNDNNAQSEIPLQQFDNQGYVFWGSVRNGETFVFDNIDQYQDDTMQDNIAKQIRTYDSLKVYADSSFPPDASYLINKALNGIKIKTADTYDPSCVKGVLYLTTTTTPSGDCIVFAVDPKIAYNESESLVYYLIRE